MVGTLLLLALGVRAFVASRSSEELTIDRDAYLSIADQLVQGHGYAGSDGRPTAFRPPVYPLTIAAGRAATGWPVARVVALINELSGLVVVLATIMAARALRLRPLGILLAGLLVAVSPLLVRYASQPMTESLFTALYATAMAAAVGLCRAEELAGRRDSEVADITSRMIWSRALWLGVWIGLAGLCRPTAWPWAAGLLLAAATTGAQRLWRNDRAGARRLWGLTVLAAVPALALLGGWTIFNAVRLGTPIATTTHGGYTLLLANNEVFDREVVQQPWGTVWSGESLAAWQQSLDLRMRAELGSDFTSEVARDRWQSREAWRFIGQQPGAFVRGVWYRVRKFWSPLPGTSDANSNGALSRGETVVGVFYAVWFFGALVGGVVVVRELRRARPGARSSTQPIAPAEPPRTLEHRLLEHRLLAPGVEVAAPRAPGVLSSLGLEAAWGCVLWAILSVLLLHCVYWTDTRMRAPIEPALALLAGASLVARRAKE